MLRASSQIFSRPISGMSCGARSVTRRPSMVRTNAKSAPAAARIDSTISSSGFTAMVLLVGLGEHDATRALVSANDAPPASLGHARRHDIGDVEGHAAD